MKRSKVEVGQGKLRNGAPQNSADVEGQERRPRNPYTSSTKKVKLEQSIGRPLTKEHCSNFSQLKNPEANKTTTKDFKSSLTQCPVKLFATQRDMSVRTQHSNDHNHWSYTQCWTLREMLGVDDNGAGSKPNGTHDSIDWLFLSNYILDCAFLLDEVPELTTIPTTVVLYGRQDSNSKAVWQERVYGAGLPVTVDFVHRDPSQPKQSSSNPLTSEFPWGCHHTKMFLVGFSSGRLRVIVHSSNLRWNDVHLKCQGAYIEDFWPKEGRASSDGCVGCDFEETLVAYLETYHYHKQHKWHPNHISSPCSLDVQVRNYDFSTARGVLVPSTPGFHRHPRDTKKYRLYHNQGYLKIKSAIERHVVSDSSTNRQSSGSLSAFSQLFQPSSSTASRPIVCQFSSIGSLSAKYLEALWSAWDIKSAQNSKSRPTAPGRRSTTSPGFSFQLVYPTVQEIFQSVEGLPGGGSVPGRIKNVSKGFLQPLLHRWTKDRAQSNITSGSCDGSILGKGCNVPHIKTYYQVQQGRKGREASMRWFVLSSHNLSKAAWGEFQQGPFGEILKISHWELGVFVSPETLGVSRLVPFVVSMEDAARHSSPQVGEEAVAIPLPYPFHPERYGPTDKPWTVD